MDLCFSHGIVGPLGFRRNWPEVPIVSHTGAVLMKRERQEELHHGYRWYAQVDATLVDRLERDTYRQSKWAHIVSTNLVARERQRYFKLPAGFFHVCPYGLNLDRFNRTTRHADMRAAYGVPSSAMALLTVARLVPLKNIQLVVRALAKCRRPDVFLFVVGDGEEAQPLRRLATELGVAERVKFTGHIDEPAPFYSASDVFVLPSFVESFGIVYGEAMLMGLPCIGLRSDPPRVLSAAEDVIVNDRTGYCVGDLDELVARIDRLGEDERLRAEMGRRGAEWARARYSSDHYVNFILDLAHRQFGVDVPAVPLSA
jgi:glycosyltransferase involved in cell wall biosynthesis